MKRLIVFGWTSILLIGLLTGCGTVKSEYLLDVDYSHFVKLCDYKGIEVDKILFEVSEEEISEQMEMELYDYAEYEEITDRGIQKGDYVMMDYTAMLDGEVSESYSGKEEEIVIGEEYFYPEVEKKLIGMKTGETLNMDVVLTQEYAEEGDEGKTLSLEVKIGTISEEILPSYTDEFVKENMDFASVEEYKADVKRQLVESKEEEYKQIAIGQAMDYIVNNSTFNGYPEELYAECEEYYDAENESYAAMYGMEMEDFLDFMGIDEEARKEGILEMVHYDLVIGAIAQKEKIDCTKQEIDKFVEDSYSDYEYESAEEFLEAYAESDIGYQLIYEKVTEAIYQNATYIELDEEAYLKQQEEEMEEEEMEDEEMEDEEIEGEEDFLEEDFTDDSETEVLNEEETVDSDKE